ncbi:hypothetical protein QYM36_015459, partial [Artemia franciscana]
MDIMMRQNSLPWNSDSDYSVWNPRTLSTFQTFHGGSNGIIGNGILHSHSRSMLVEEPIEKPKPKRLASRSLGEPQEFISLNNGTLLVRDGKVFHRELPKLGPDKGVKSGSKITEGDDSRQLKSLALLLGEAEGENLILRALPGLKSACSSLDGTMEVRIGLGPSDKRFGFSVTGGSEDEVSKPCIDKITE